MAFDYMDRKLWSVHVHGFSVARIEQEKAAASGVTIILSAATDETLPGPKIDMEFAFPASGEQTLRELQSEALATAAAILARLSRETAESLSEAAQAHLEKKMFPDPA